MLFKYTCIFREIQHKKKLKLSFIIPFLFLLFLIIIINSSANYASQPVLLKNADSLLGISDLEQNIRNFIGNVVFEQGNIILKCDTAIQYLNDNRVDLIGNVVIEQNNMIIKSKLINYFGNDKKAFAKKNIEIQDTANTLKASSGTYNFDSKIAEFTNNVTVENDSLKIYSDFLINNTETDESFASGDVKIFGKKARTAVVCDTLIHKPKQSFLLTYGHSGFFYIDTLRNSSIKDEMQTLKFDTLEISSNTIFGNQVKGYEFYQFYDSVEIVKGNVFSKCKRADFFMAGDSLLLTGEPVVWYDSLQLFADTISVFFPKQSLKQIKLIMNSLAISQADTLGVGRINQISGINIDINFERDSISAILSKEKANSLYFMTSDSGETGAQSSGADSIRIVFDKNEVQNIIWKSAAFIDFYPEKILNNNLKQLYLPRFRIRYDKPKRKLFPLQK